MGKLIIFGPKGDETLVWSDEITEAEVKNRFDELIAQNFLAFKVGSEYPDAPPVQIRDFDPEAEEIIVMPPLQGGAT